MSLEEISSEIKKSFESIECIKSLVTVMITLLNNYEPDKIIYCLKLQYPEIEIDYLSNITNDTIDTNDTSKIDENNKKMASNIIRNDAKFREDVKARFKTCIICDSNTCISECCEVAHIWDFALCDSQSAYNPDNGLLMCANWHLLFDKHLMKLEPIEKIPGMVRMKLDNELINTSLYNKYNGKTIMLLPENIRFLKKRIATYTK